MRQYIGARYTPKFMGLFDSRIPYEALSVVEDGRGNSFINSANVPAGTSLSDTTYWRPYGTASGAIVNLQNQIDVLNDFKTANENATFVQNDKRYAVFFGDSLTAGDMGGVMADKAYPIVYGEISGLDVTNKGVNGQSAADHGSGNYLSQSIATTNFADFDQMFICHGCNDFSGNSELGNIEDRTNTTFYGAIISAILAAYAQNPKIEVVLITTFFALSTTNEGSNAMQTPFNALGYTVYDYIEAMKNIAAHFNLRCVSMQDALGVNRDNYSVYLNDDVHMNQDGYIMVGRYLAKQLSFPKPSTITDVRQYDKEKEVANMIDVGDFDNCGELAFTAHPNFKYGNVIKLTIGDVESALSRRRYKLKGGRAYSFHSNVSLPNGLTFIADISAGNNARRIAFYTNNRGAALEIPINIVFTVPADGDYILSFGVYSGAGAGGSIYISDISISEGMRSVSHEKGNDIINGTFWKESVLGTGCTSNTNSPFGYSLDDNGIVHFKGCIDCANAPSAAYNDLCAIPTYFCPPAGADLVAATSTGQIVVLHINSDVGVVSVRQNTSITAPYTIDMNGVSFNIVRDIPNTIAPIVAP